MRRTGEVPAPSLGTEVEPGHGLKLDRNGDAAADFAQASDLRSEAARAAPGSSEPRIWIAGRDTMLGAALVRVCARAGRDVPGGPLPSEDRAAERLAERLAAVRPEVVVFADDDRTGLGGHRAAPASLASGVLVGFRHVLEACRRAGVPRIVNVLSHCAYPAEAPVPLREDTFWAGPPSPSLAAYGQARRTTVALGEAARCEHGLRVVSVVLPGRYGPGDRFDPEHGQVVASLIARFEAARRAGRDGVTCWGSGRPRRELLYVDDAARALLRLAALSDDTLDRLDGGLVNVGAAAGAIEVSIRRLAEAVAAAVGYDGRLCWDTSRPDGRPRVRLDDGAYRRVIGATAVSTALDVGLQQSVADCRAWTDRRARPDGREQVNAARATAWPSVVGAPSGGLADGSPRRESVPAAESDAAARGPTPGPTRSRVVIVPTWCERASIVRCLERVTATLPDCDVLVVDDASPDGTADRARQWAAGRTGVAVWTRPDVDRRPGLGHALRAAWSGAAADGYRMACVLDADLQHTPEQARALLDAIEGGADVAVGARATRFAGKLDGSPDGAAATLPVSWRDRLADAPSRLLAAWLRLAFGVEWRDPTTGFVVLRLAALTPEMLDPGSSAGQLATLELRLRVARAGGTVVELPARCHPRRSGQGQPLRRRVLVLRDALGLWLALRGGSVTGDGDGAARGAGEDGGDKRRRALGLGAGSGFGVSGDGDHGMGHGDGANRASDGGRRGGGTASAAERVRRLVRSGDPVRLHLACGKRHLPGWFHIDIDPWPHVDLRRPAEDLSLFPDDAVDEIYNCHQIGYYDRSQIGSVLREWRRVLKPGARLRIATADFEAVVAEYRAGRPLPSLDGLVYGRYPVAADSLPLGPGCAGTGRRPEEAGDRHGDMDRRRRGSDGRRPALAERGWGGLRVPIYYRASYDFATLAAVLRAAGFHDVRRYDWRATDHAHIDDYAQAYLPHMDKENGRLMSLNVEARA